jgi:hypothetical protein
VPASSPAAGFGGTPLARQCSSASTNAFWTASSATPTSPTGPPAHRGSGWPPPDRPSPARRHRPRSPVFSCLRPPLTRHHPPRWRHRTCTRGVSPAAPAPASALRVSRGRLETAQQSSALPLEAVANQMQIAQIWAAITAHRSGSGTVQNEHLFVSESRGAALMRCRSGSPAGGLSCARHGFFSRGGHYRLARGRFKDALAAPLRGRAAPGP